MISTRADSILTINLFVITVLEICGVCAANYGNGSATLGVVDRTTDRQAIWPTVDDKSRLTRDLYYKNYPIVEHEIHEHIGDQHYIYKVIAPPKRREEVGIKELLLVLAPLAAIPLIGSAALTTWTALATTGSYGGRRKRDLLTNELFANRFTEVQPKSDHYISHRAIGEQEESYVANSERTVSGSGLPAISVNAKRQAFPEIDSIRTKIDTSFASQKDHTEPKSRVIGISGVRVLAEDRNNWRPIDTTRNDGTGGTKSVPIIGNKLAKSESTANRQHKGLDNSAVNGTDMRFTQSVGGQNGYSGNSGRNDREADRDLLAYPSTKEKADRIGSQASLAYHNSSDFIIEPIIVVNNKTDNIYFGAVPSANIKGHNNFRDTSQLGLNLTADLKTDETQALDKRNADNIKSGANGRTDQRQDYNTWIPFLHKPHLTQLTRGQNKRDIEELDVIQKYLNAMGRPDYNDEIIASYLSCNGMTSDNNKCLERLTCQYSDPTSAMKPLEKEVSALVIYSLLKNEHIESSFKSRLRRAAQVGKDQPGQCILYTCAKGSFGKKTKR